MPKKSVPQPGLNNWGTPLNNHLAQLQDSNTGGINLSAKSTTTGDDEGYTHVDSNKMYRVDASGNPVVILDADAGGMWQPNSIGNGITPTSSATNLMHVLDDGRYFRGDWDVSHETLNPNYNGSRPDIEIEKNATTAQETRVDIGSLGSNNFAAFQANSDQARYSILAHGSARTLSRFDNTLAGTTEIVNFGNADDSPSALLMGTFKYDPLILGTNNEERMRITQDGNVGIHTSNPTQELHVYDDSGDAVTNNTIAIGRDFDLPALGLGASSGVTYANQMSSSLKISGYNRDRSDIDYNLEHYGNYTGAGITLNAIQTGTQGNAGIGIRSRVSDGSEFFSENEGSLLKYNDHLPHMAANPYGGAYVMRNRHNDTYVNMIALNANSDIRFVQGTSPSDANTKVMIKDGNLGVGTVNPTSKMSVVGLPTSPTGLASGDFYLDDDGNADGYLLRVKK